MRFLVDTNVISELYKRQPNKQAMAWIESHESSIYFSAITLEELRLGEQLMANGKKRRELGAAIDDLCRIYSDRFLDFDALAADKCGALHAASIKGGYTPDIEDLMIAATASVNNMAVATRNTRDFEYFDLPVVNPFLE